MLPLIENDRYQEALAVRREFDQKVADLAGRVGAEYRGWMDLVAMLWPVKVNGFEVGKEAVSAVYIFGRGDRSNRSSFYFGVSLWVRLGELSAVMEKVEAFSKEAPLEHNRGVALVRGMEGKRTEMVVELEGKEKGYSLLWQPDPEMDYTEEWQVDVLAEAARVLKLAMVASLLQGVMLRRDAYART